jgi:hypothetical protein
VLYSIVESRDNVLEGMRPPSSPPYTVVVIPAKAGIQTETLFIVDKPMIDRVFCFHGNLENLGNLDTSCHVLSRSPTVPKCALPVILRPEGPKDLSKNMQRRP